jgi:hypothetical protein
MSPRGQYLTTSGSSLRFPKVAEGGLRFTDLVVVDMSETCELNLTRVNGATGSGADLRQTLRVFLLLRAGVEIAPLPVARIAQGGRPQQTNFKAPAEWVTTMRTDGCQPRKRRGKSRRKALASSRL